MAMQPGRHTIGMAQGRITLRTTRDGLVALAGHDLTIEASRWSGELVTGQDGSPVSLDVTIDLNALVVRDGTGGVRPVTERDKREIEVTTRRVLRADRHPQATFTATAFEPSSGGAIITGTLALAGRSQTQQLQVSEVASGIYRATATVRQTDFGIQPYTAFLGSLKVSDAVQVTAELDLSQATGQESAT